MPAMDAYLKKLLAKRAKRSSVELTWELHETLQEKAAGGGKLSPAERAALHYCTVSTCDGIEEVLEESPDSLGITAEFAKQRGLEETARILADAAKGVPFKGPVSFAAGMEGEEMKPLEVDLGEWGATDIALSVIEEDLDEAILDFVAEKAAEFQL
jgi:hypothetical protein